jgi:hypothetical protein
MVAVFSVLMLGSPAQAQVTTLPILKRTLAVVAKEEAIGNQIIFVTIDNVEKGANKSHNITLPANAKYRIYAVGDDERILDIDLVVLDSNGREVGRDDDDQNVAIVEVRVRRTQQYTLKVIPDKLKAGVQDGFFSLVVVRID